MKAELARTRRSWRSRFTFAALAVLSLAPTGTVAAGNGLLGYPCGQMPGKLPQDKTGVLAGLPPATLAGYLDYPIPIKKSPYENFKPKHAAPWKVIHIGNFVGNDWHVIQIAQFDKTASAMKAAGLISDFSQVHADASVPVQIQQMRTAVQQGYDAIILEPNSESALNAVIDQAFKAGIVVVIQDSPADSINAINVGGNAVQYGGTKAQELVAGMGGKGKVLMVSGLPGNPDNTLFEKGAHSVFDNCPDVKVEQTLEAGWDPAAAKSMTLQYLETHRGQKIDGVWDSSGMAIPAIQAFQTAGVPVPTVVNGNPDKGYLAYWLANKDKGFQGGANALPSASGADAAMRVALKVLQGQGLKVSDIPAQIPTLTVNDLSTWVDASWTPDTPGMTDQTVGKYLSDDILAPLFNKPAPTIP
jgi:ribose transport system substrate-binding protein